MADRASPRILQSKRSPSPFTFFFSPSQTLKGQPLIGLAPDHHAHSHCLWTASRSLVVCSHIPSGTVVSMDQQNHGTSLSRFGSSFSRASQLFARCWGMSTITWCRGAIFLTAHQ
ncbi:uncharacterized protein LACBIDRAFT_319095 [Laccaria bicolor S238N-H82]|uniref:Predicted protein n=1 Tax=Laccaria bicolor (strain S238N-H82 / ATCC MYA-4686) TaxID=486041 RepID=B0D7V4_LACBS|nr:uncharacterized protein LACBIDRAFT_319095 [Laccaria bicolor S238N-H82]EDR09469.1 predicted protein [Laccaria bicolor S238N-H82]|eukprot:XP_001879818.1 predicted protein [Laccaria bicolor S238N-H82]